MFRSALFITAAALAAACAGQPLTANPTARHAPGQAPNQTGSSPTGIEPAGEAAGDTVLEIDRRADRLSMHGQWDEARRLVERGLEAARGRGDRAGEARLLLRRGQTITDQTRHSGGDRAPAHADLQAALRAAEAAGDLGLVGEATDTLGMLRFFHWFSTQDPADLAAAHEMLRKALAIRESIREPGGLADSYFHAGLVHQMRGELDAAHAQFERSLATAEQARDELRMSYATRHLAYIADRRGDWAHAEGHYRRSLELREKFGEGPAVAAALVALAELRYKRDGKAQAALDMLQRAHDCARRTGSFAYVAISSAAIARVHRDHRQHDQALQRFAAAIRAMDEIRSDEDVPEVYEQLALVHLLDGDSAAAVAEAERGIARRSTPRLVAVLALARARAGQPATPVAGDTKDPVVAARLALAAGRAAAALDAAVLGEDPDTLLLAARAVGPAGFARAIAAAQKMSSAQKLRFEREAGLLRR
jgi:tetratricopeptide (TPR) repeat protein